MAFFNRFKKQQPEIDDCQHLSALGDDPDAWDGLDDDKLKQVVSVKFIEYGATQDGSRIAGLFALDRAEPAAAGGGVGRTVRAGATGNDRRQIRVAQRGRGGVLEGPRSLPGNGRLKKLTRFHLSASHSLRFPSDLSKAPHLFHHPLHEPSHSPHRRQPHRPFLQPLPGSPGTPERGALRLATRLALSQLHLKGMAGFFFFLLDDPFTAMDSTRRAAAIRAIGAFEENHRVLFHTCHPGHAGELQSLAGAKSLQLIHQCLFQEHQCELM